MEFADVSEFWKYVQSTKASSIRTVFFTAGSNGLRVHQMHSRQPSTHADVHNILQSLLAVSQPVWCVIRCDFNDVLDNHFKLGHLGIPTAATQRIAQSLRIRCRYYSPSSDLEDQIWDHLFPLSEETVTHSLDNAAVILDSSTAPRFSLLSPVNVSELCRSRQCCFLLSAQSPDQVLVQLFVPEGPCRRCRTTSDSQKEKTVYAFMKAELVPWLRQLAANTLFMLDDDIHSCGDVSRGAPRRRSNEDVLSPPTLDKYNKGASKRSKNFPDARQLFSDSGA